MNRRKMLTALSLLPASAALCAAVTPSASATEVEAPSPTASPDRHREMSARAAEAIEAALRRGDNVSIHVSAGNDVFRSCLIS